MAVMVCTCHLNYAGKHKYKDHSQFGLDIKQDPISKKDQSKKGCWSGF
jgi:hypothetical protein